MLSCGTERVWPAAGAPPRAAPNSPATGQHARAGARQRADALKAPPPARMQPAPS